MALLQLSFFIFCLLVDKISGHGMMLQPPNRSSLWRFNPNAPPNYNDNQNYCGGAGVQWASMGGKCGVCGDKYDDPHPQANENTGKYGQGIIAAEYKSGSSIDVEVLLTTNHKGFFNFSLCVLQNPNKHESGEDCFQPLKLANGDNQYNVVTGEKTINTQIQLPSGLKCDRCVLRWHYQAGNNWGQCEDGSYNQGCGPQETFRSCADITIS
ncbi:uncharacterized protein LOC123011330 [Tribolium madens]|uniref:uncharacterized protein LOC123011330 n=1 Tax=Tribolium madens TaxID=41895 RepID=UPI001CF7576D|nr:uncharacterized protein LOC123011330 [Tribolium madens]